MKKLILCMFFFFCFVLNGFAAPFNNLIDFKAKLDFGVFSQDYFNFSGKFPAKEGIFVGLYNDDDEHDGNSDYFLRPSSTQKNGILPVFWNGKKLVSAFSKTFISFTTPVKDFSVDLGDNGEDVDEIFLELYGMNDNGLFLIDTVSDIIPEGDSFFHTLEYEGTIPISYVLFWGRCPYITDSSLEGANTVYFNNVSFNTVPLPGTAILFLSGMIGFWGLISRRKIA